MKKLWIIPLMATIFGCLQGPWSYTPDEVKVDKGITVEAHVVAGRPLTDVCFERLLELDETYTNAFAFFDSAEVIIEGDFGSGTESLTLNSKTGDPMCFVGDQSKLGQAGNSYTLNGVFLWDSAGTTARTIIKAETKIPTSIKIDTLAWANSLALSQNLNQNDQEGILSLFNSLPDSISAFFLDKYLPEIGPIADDSVALQAWFQQNGRQINSELDSLLLIYEEYVQYAEFDTVSYLSGALNTTSHYYKAIASDDVGGILITQRLDSNSFQPKNRFDEIAERFTELGPESFYYPSRIRRLIYYSRFQNDDYDIFDSLPVVNTWLFSGKNVLYFYATDSNYAKYVNTTLSEEDNSKVKKFNAVEGGNGYFTGMLVDSFVVNVRIPPNVDSYHITEARAAWCDKNDWDNKNCREYVFEYCHLTSFNDLQYQFDNPEIFSAVKSYRNCLDVVAYDALVDKKDPSAEIENVFPGSNVSFQFKTDEGVIDSMIAFKKEEIDDAINAAQQKYCIATNFGEPFCKDIKTECLKEDSKSQCKENAYDYCIDNEWQGASCDWMLYLYCLQPTINSEILCGSRNNNFCQSNPKDIACLK